SEVSLVAAVHKVLDTFDPQKLQTHQIALDISEALLVKADKEYLHRILLNLLSNALKYSPEQTTVSINATQRLCSSQNADGCSEVYICVQDAGPGIPPSDIPLLFGKFVRLKR